MFKHKSFQICRYVDVENALQKVMICIPGSMDHIVIARRTYAGSPLVSCPSSSHT